MNILYLPIYEPGTWHERAVKNKRGLYTALVKLGHSVIDLDYLARHQASGNLHGELNDLMHIFQPDLVLTQLHGADIVTPAMAEDLRLAHPAQWINWSGDAHRHSLTSEPMIDLMRFFDWMLVPTPDVLPELAEAGVQAAYWNIAYEPIRSPKFDVPAYDVIFQGNLYTDQRKEMVAMLRELPYKVGIYGDWEHADGNTVYDFPMQNALNRSAKLAIADYTKVDDLSYVSDRPMNIMAAGGALCLHQRVNRMDALTGWKNGVHYIEWNDLDELKSIITYWLDPIRANPRLQIATRAQEQVLFKHSFGIRATELLTNWVRP